MGKVTVEVRRKKKDFVAADPSVVNAQGAVANTEAVLPGSPPSMAVMPGAAAGGTGKPAAARTLDHTDYTYRITYTQTVYVPDPSKRFAVRYQPNALAQDDIHIQIGKDSLLALVEVTAEDRSVEASKKLIEIGANVFKIAQRGALAFGAEAAQEETIFAATFDPISSENLRQINGLLRDVDGGPYTVSVLNRSSPDYKAVSSTYRSSEVGKREFSGVAFRPVLAYDLSLKHGKTPQEVDTVLLPNEAEILYMPVTRSAFVKKVESLNFNAGMLVEAKINKPSEIEAGLDIPLEITRTILALPGDIVADNVAGLKQRDGLNQQKLQTVQSQGALDRGKIDDQILTQQEKVKQMQAPPGATPGPSPKN